ncbi:MAG: MBL fold metallo-hydrolase [Acidimicrobiia bacterium]|nr:MBL fold metallo-hydrolase [Acidimicrobiia bacterium]
MATEVMITGSGIPLPSPGRAGAGALVRHDSTMIQVDAGPATTLRLTEANVDLTQLAGLVITHHHSDHLMGIPDLVLTRWIRNGAHRCPPLPIHCPAGHAVDYVESLFDNLQPDIEARIGLAGFPDRPEVAVHPFEPQESPTVVATFGEVLVESILVEHGGVRPAVAYRFSTPDGVLVVSGDTRACDAVEDLAAGADILVHEVLSSSKLLELGLPHQRVERLGRLHAEAPTLGALAARAGVGQLVLTHLMPAPRGSDDEAELVEAIRAGGYAGRVTVASDLHTARV